MAKYATTNIIGPDGTLVEVCNPIPAEWDNDVVADLEKAGAVGSKVEAEAAFIASHEGIDTETEAVLHAINPGSK